MKKDTRRQVDELLREERRATRRERELKNDRLIDTIIEAVIIVVFIGAMCVVLGG